MQYCEGDEDSDDEVNEESWCTCLSSHEVSISFYVSHVNHCKVKASHKFIVWLFSVIHYTC